jgi:hypothetical protein
MSLGTDVRDGSQTHPKTSALFSCVYVAAAEVTLPLARGNFLGESVPTEFLILQQRSSTMAKKAKKKKAKKKK